MNFNQNWHVGIATDEGPVKVKNEDDFFMRSLLDADGGEFTILAIADGMGGHKHGDRASRKAVQMLDSWWIKRVKKYVRKGSSLQFYVDKLTGLFEDINHALIVEDMQAGTTLSVLLMYNGNYAICHIGDSRIYQLRGGNISNLQLLHHQKKQMLDAGRMDEQSTEMLETELEIIQLTSDHSWVEQQVRKGVLTKEEARTHQKRNVLTQCLGIQKDIQPYVQIGRYQSYDLFLLCSDGFHGMFSDEEMGATIDGLGAESDDLQVMANYLVNLANFSGTKDNITVMLVQHNHLYKATPKVREKSIFSFFKK